jgi:hypothetical protein
MQIWQWKAIPTVRRDSVVVKEYSGMQEHGSVPISM